MRLRVLGCSGSVPGPDSAASGYLLEAPWSNAWDGETFRMVIDMGSGVVGALQRFATHGDPFALDAVGITHLHPDHCQDLGAYYTARRIAPGRAARARRGPAGGPASGGPPAGAAPAARDPRIPVYGPYATGDRLAVAHGLPVEPGMRDEFDFRAWAVGQPLRIGPCRVTAAIVDHPVAAYALRIECRGKVLVFSGDTGPCRAIAELAVGADLFLCEASFLSAEPHPGHLHLTGLEAGAYARQGGVGRLVLTHIPPWVDGARVLAEARSAYDGPAELARPGATYEL